MGWARRNRLRNNDHGFRLDHHGRRGGAPRGLRGSRFPDMLDELDPVVLQDALRTPDRVTLAVEEMADAAQQINVVGTVVAAPAAALQLLDLLETRFPETQHVLRQVEFVRNFS